MRAYLPSFPSDQREIVVPFNLDTTSSLLEPRSDETIPFWRESYGELDIDYQSDERAVWCHMRPSGPPSFTPTMLKDMIRVRRGIQQFVAGQRADDRAIAYFVFGSRLPGIFNLGGDLRHFASCIRSGDREALAAYAHDCIDVVFHTHQGLEAGIVTVALVQGDALGGGFEAALSFDVIVAERSAKFGLPEILFNLFPGMGAYSFLSRRLDGARAQRMILSGRIYGAEELHAMGLVDVLAEDGRGEEAVRTYITQNRRNHPVHRAIYDVRRRVHPVTYDELRAVTEIWLDTALGLTEADLRRMERLTAAQTRRALSL